MKYFILLLIGFLSSATVSQEIDISVNTEGVVVTDNGAVESDSETAEETKPTIDQSVPSVAFVPKHALERFNQQDKGTAIDIEVEKLYRRAHVLQAEGSIDLAIQTYHKIISKKPDYEKARISLAQVLAVKGDYSGIVSILMPATENKHSHWSAWYWLGVAFMKQGNFEMSIQATEEALARNVESVDLWLLRALIEQETDDHHSALQLLSAAEHLAPNHPNIVLNKAISNEAIGQINLALVNYSRYLKLVKGTTNRAIPNNVVLDRITRLRTFN